MELLYFTEEQTSRAKLEGFVIRAGEQVAEKGTEFLQSYVWGEILQAEGNEIRRLGVIESGRLLLAATLIKKSLFGRFSYWYAPRGPIVEPGLSLEDKNRVLTFFYESLKNSPEKPVFLRQELIFKEVPAGYDICKTHNLQPAKTLVLDLQNSPAELLAAMHQKTRYNIHLAEKKGVVVRPGGAEDLPEFWRLLTLTGTRDAFSLHPRAHYQQLLASGQGRIKLFFAEFQCRKIAAALVVFWGNKGIYLHGASDNQARNLMAPYLLQWEMIKEAQSQGFRYYDFYGIDEQKWPGVTRFKLGFGGKVVDYPGTSDVVFRRSGYYLYKLLRQIRRLV